MGRHTCSCQHYWGFGLEALPIIAMVGTLVDSPATMINSSGDTVAAMIVNRLVSKPNGLEKLQDQSH